MADSRPSWKRYGVILARAVATRADCTRRQVGAVILDKDNRVASTGYNGSYSGGPSCLAGECPRGRHYLSPKRHDPLGLSMCACGRVWPCPEAVEPGSSYDTGPGACIGVHAEMNAILLCDTDRLVGATLCVTDKPCDGCLKHISQTRIAHIVYPEGEALVACYRDSQTRNWVSSLTS